MSPRWLARLALPTLVGAALVTSAPIAAAQTADELFLAKLAAIGFVWPQQQRQDVVNLGHHICIDRLSGWTRDQVLNDVHAVMASEGFTFDHVDSIVDAAEAVYCAYEPGFSPG